MPQISPSACSLKLPENDPLILEGDTRIWLPQIPDASVHLILSDIPYGISLDAWDILHNNQNTGLGGQSPAQKDSRSGFEKRGKPINGWSEADRQIPKEYERWCASWAKDCFRVLKPGASCLLFAGRRLAHRALVALEDAGFDLRDQLAWEKDRASLKAQRLSKVFERRRDEFHVKTFQGWRIGNLRPTFEPILWLVKPYPQGQTISDNMLIHGVGAFHEEAWRRYVPSSANLIRTPTGMNQVLFPLKGHENKGLRHPTQKPLELMAALIELVTLPGHIVLDPFMGSGTTLLAAFKLHRRAIGIEQNPHYVDLAKARLQSLRSDESD